MVRKSGPKGHVALKLDLEKAYDRLKWSFIRKLLNSFKTPLDWFNFIEYAFFNLFSYYVEWYSFTCYYPK